MIPALLESQIQRQMEETRTQALLSAMFDRINKTTEPPKEKTDSKKKKYWWIENDK